MTNINSVHAGESLDTAHVFCYIFVGETNAEFDSDSAKTCVLIYTICRREKHLQGSLTVFHLVIIIS